MLEKYFKSLYQRTMQKAYSLAHNEIAYSLKDGGKCLDCGAHKGHKYGLMKQTIGLEQHLYHGIEWHADLVEAARAKGLNVMQGDLNKKMLFPNDMFKCIFGLSVLEHLLNPCHYLRECYRCLEKSGTLVLLTPNISTYFTVALLLSGRMPSTGPHPDSDALLKQEELFKVSHESLQPDSETRTPVHRHLIVFSYKALKSYLMMLGFREIEGHGFGLYPFPNFMQNFLERIDPYHCHQMVFVARK
jgi:SAM-dependent methyltransferase